mmetsp:Transcript_3843/g.5133  ORF Transcript_3843/g.5133 Transcript_3843/m.5133 type:complete len:343 (+) Transcript_3843:51-1079(+)|eukprot:jgi/Bigna1/147326/aug1.141_g22034
MSSSLVLLLTASSFLSEASRLEAASQLQEVDGNQLRLLMCVTGQLGRLEYSSKNENFVKDNAAKGHVVDVVMVIDDEDETQFVNKKYDESTAAGNDTKAMVQQATRAFERYANTVRYVSHQQPAEPEPAQWYINSLDKTDKSRFDIEAVERFRTHVRQFETMSQCYEQMMELEYEAGKQYDEILRVRDDGYIIEPITLLHEMKRKKPADFLVNECDSWQGYNDKAALIRRPVADTYLRGLLRAIYLRGEYLLPKAQLRVKNPETLLKSVLLKSQFTAVESRNYMPISPLRTAASSGFDTDCLDMKVAKCWGEYISKAAKQGLARCKDLLASEESEKTKSSDE